MIGPVTVQIIASPKSAQAVRLLQFQAKGASRFMRLTWAHDNPDQPALAEPLSPFKLALLIGPRGDLCMLLRSMLLRVQGVLVCWLHVGPDRPYPFSGLVFPTDGRPLYIKEDFRERADEEARWVALIRTLCQLAEAVRQPRRLRRTWRLPAWMLLALCLSNLLIACVLALPLFRRPIMVAADVPVRIEAPRCTLLQQRTDAQTGAQEYLLLCSEPAPSRPKPRPPAGGTGSSPRSDTLMIPELPGFGR